MAFSRTTTAIRDYTRSRCRPSIPAASTTKRHRPSDRKLVDYWLGEQESFKTTIQDRYKPLFAEATVHDSHLEVLNQALLLLQVQWGAGCIPDKGLPRNLFAFTAGGFTWACDDPDAFGPIFDEGTLQECFATLSRDAVELVPVLAFFINRHPAHPNVDVTAALPPIPCSVVVG